MEIRMSRSIEQVCVGDTLPPVGVCVIVAGGVAKIKEDGIWYTGMEEPVFERPLEWSPKWWAKIPLDNEV